MNNWNSSKQYEQREKKDYKEKTKELQELRTKIIQLQQMINEQKFRRFTIKNFKQFVNVCNFLTPFIISAGLTVGSVKLSGGGYPFHIDKIIKYKVYSLEYQTNGFITIDESYIINEEMGNILPQNELIIYTPWEYKNNQYTRYKREYNIRMINTIDLFDAVLEENYTYITENIKEYKEEVQTVNSIEQTDGQDYIFEANLYMLDKEDTLKYNETEFKNNVITIIEILLGLGIGGALTYFKNFKYLCEIKDEEDNYQYRLKAIKPISYELTEPNEKLMIYSRKKRGGK